MWRLHLVHRGIAKVPLATCQTSKECWIWG
jgi:hypothetical protein